MVIEYKTLMDSAVRGARHWQCCMLARVKGRSISALGLELTICRVGFGIKAILLTQLYYRGILSHKYVTIT